MPKYVCFLIFLQIYLATVLGPFHFLKIVLGLRQESVEVREMRLGEGDEVKGSVGIGAGSPEQPGEAAQSGGYPELGRLRHAVRGPQPVRHSPVGPGPRSPWGRAPAGERLRESACGRAPAGELLRESSWGSALARRPVLPPFTGCSKTWTWTPLRRCWGSG